MAVLCLLTNTPWPWPTPAGAASARGGFPTLGTERERSGGGVAQRRSAQAKRGRLGCLLSRARDGVPQEAWFPKRSHSSASALQLSPMIPLTVFSVPHCWLSVPARAQGFWLAFLICVSSTPANVMKNSPANVPKQPSRLSPVRESPLVRGGSVADCLSAGHDETPGNR
jgi:hypothetical protein